MLLQIDLQFPAHFDDVVFRRVVLVAVGEHQPHVHGKLVGVLILAFVKLFLEESRSNKWGLRWIPH